MILDLSFFEGLVYQFLHCYFWVYIFCYLSLIYDNWHVEVPRGWRSISPSHVCGLTVWVVSWQAAW